MFLCLQSQGPTFHTPTSCDTDELPAIHAELTRQQGAKVARTSVAVDPDATAAQTSRSNGSRVCSGRRSHSAHDGRPHGEC